MDDDDNLELDDLLDDSLSDTSCVSEPDDQPQSVNVDLSNGWPFNDDDFLVIHYNINSITAADRLEELSEVLKLTKCSVLICTESKLDKTIPTSLLTITGFHEPVRRDRTRHGGGCLVYVSDIFTFKQQVKLQSEKYEHIWIDVRVADKIYSINCFYRPPDYENHTEFLEESDKILARLSQHKANNKIIASDLNFGNVYCKFPILDPKPLDNSAPELFSSHGFDQLIDIPTRVTSSCISLIDLIYCTDRDNIQCHGTLPKIADHDGTFVSFHCSKPKPKLLTRTVYDYKNIDENGLINFINTYDFETSVFNQPISNQAEALTEILNEALNKFVPVKKITIRPTDQSWVNSYTRLLMRKKNRNYQIFKKINSKFVSVSSQLDSPPELVTRLREKKNRALKKSKISARESTNANRRSKQAFFNSVNSIMHNFSISAKKKFSILSKLMKSQKASNVPSLIKNGDVVNDPETKSNIFNDLFASKATVQGQDDPVPFLHEKNFVNSLRKVNTSRIEVAKFCREIKKSNSSYCGIPGKFLAIISTPISFPLYKLFNNLFEIGHFPEIFKISHITALWKKSGLKSDPSMYRPISLLPTLSKIMESIIHKRLLDHFMENNIISERQAAYLKGDSTIQQLLYIVNLIRTSWTRGDITQGIFLDVSAAFDKCWHSGILAKLKQNKVEGECLDLFNSYLSNRKQVVVVDGIKSEMKDIGAGVPQGSRLGPLLWILYVNDIVESLESEVLLFADDTCLFASARDPAQTADILNRDLTKISEWATRWKVSFNPNKSKDLIFSSKKVLQNSPPLMFNNTYVTRVHEHRHLGVWLSSSLSWSRQIHETCLRANGKLAVLRSVKFLSRSTLDLLYKLTVRSVVDYGLIIYYQTLKVTEKARLDQLQYRAAKLCTGALHFSSQRKLEDDLAWESIAERADFLGLSFFQKVHLGETRPLIRGCMSKLKPGLNSRSADFGCYELFPPLGTNFTNSYFPYYTKAWNSLKNHLKGENDISLFKSNLKSVFKPKKQKHFSRGSKRGNSLLTQLRVGRSLLNSHGYSINLADSDQCLCSRPETVSHFFNHCFLYQEERQLLVSKIEKIIPKFSRLSDKRKTEILLNGINLNSDEPDSRNVPLTFTVQNYILQTRRFNSPP